MNNYDQRVACMKKEDVLKLNTTKEIWAAVSENFDIFDEEISKHFAQTAKRENKELYGNEDGFIDDPIKISVGSK